MGQLQDVRLRNTRGAWFAFAVLVIGGIASGTWSLTRSPPAPNAVLVHIEGCDEGCREAIFDHAARLLAGRGFEAVPDTERRFPTDLSRVLANARHEGASHAIFMTLDSAETREGAGGADRVQVLVEVVLDTATSDGQTLRVTRQLSLEGDDELHAQELAGDAVLEGAIDRIAALLVRSEAIETFLASEAAATEADARQRLARVRGGVAALEVARSDFEQRCDAAREVAERTEGLVLECQLRTSVSVTPCPSESPVAVLESGIVVHAASRIPRFRLGRRSEVERSPETFDRLLHWDPRARAHYMAHAPRMRPDADALGPHRSVHIELALGPSGEVIGSALVLTRGLPRRESVVLLRTETPVRIERPLLAPDGRSVIFTRQQHEHAAPELMWMAARPGSTPQPVTVFGTFGRFLERPATPREEVDPTEAGPELEADPVLAPESPDILLLVTVAGAHATEVSGVEGAMDESDRLEGQRPFGGLPTPNEEDRAAFDLPPLTHQAAMRVGTDGPSLIARIAGVRRPVQEVLGATAEGVVVASASRAFGCTVGVVAWQTWEPRWIEVGGCLLSGSVAPGPRGDAVYGTMRVAEASDPVAGDSEVVRVDLVDGRLTQLTHDGVDDTKVVAGVVTDGEVRLAIQRRPSMDSDYPRFAPAFVCSAIAPAHPGEPFTPRPPRATPPPPDAGGAPDLP